MYVLIANALSDKRHGETENGLRLIKGREQRFREDGSALEDVATNELVYALRNVQSIRVLQRVIMSSKCNLCWLLLECQMLVPSMQSPNKLSA